MKNIKNLLASAALATLALVGCQKETNDPMLQSMPNATSYKGPGQGVVTDTIFISSIEVRSAHQIKETGPKKGIAFPNITYVGERAFVTVVNHQGLLVSGVSVSGSWSGCFSSNKSATTNAQGIAEIVGANAAPSGCTATFTVTGLSKSGAYYDVAANVVSSGSKVYP